jgi:hypothetical protein
MPSPTVVSTTTPQTGAASTMALNMPASVAATDIIWGWLSLSGVIGAMPGSPAFTLKLTGDSNQVWVYIRGADHIANGSPATYTFSTTGGVITRGMASRISGVIATGDPTDGTPAVGTTTTSASSAALAITTTVVDTLLLNYDTKSSSSANVTAPTGLTLQTPGTSVAHLFAGPLAAAGGSGTKTSTYGSLTNHRSSLVALKPATTQNLAVTGFAPAAAFGTPTLIQDQFVAPSGFTPAVAFGTPTLVQDQFVTPSGFALQVDFGTPTLHQEVSPDGFAPTVVFGTPSLGQNVEPDGFEVTIDFGTPDLATVVQPDGFTPTIEFGVPTVTVDGVLPVEGFELDVVFGSPTVVRQPFVAGTVYRHDCDGEPLGAGVTVQLFDETGLLVDTTVTEPDGSYLFHVPFDTPVGYFTVARVSPTVQGVSQICEALT